MPLFCSPCPPPVHLCPPSPSLCLSAGRLPLWEGPYLFTYCPFPHPAALSSMRASRTVLSHVMLPCTSEALLLLMNYGNFYPARALTPLRLSHTLSHGPSQRSYPATLSRLVWGKGCFQRPDRAGSSTIPSIWEAVTSHLLVCLILKNKLSAHTKTQNMTAVQYRFTTARRSLEGNTCSRGCP